MLAKHNHVGEGQENKKKRRVLNGQNQIAKNNNFPCSSGQQACILIIHVILIEYR
jgi:hypothetical protein